MTPNTEDSFWSRCVKAPSGCWEWSGYRFHHGYGRISFRGRARSAHRLAWELTHGPIPAATVVCHRCDNPPCCNPAHLFLGTQADNMRDMKVKGRSHDGAHVARGEAQYAAKLTAEKVRQIRALAEAGRSRRSLADEYGVDPSNIRQIVNRTAWKHVA